MKRLMLVLFAMGMIIACKSPKPEPLNKFHDVSLQRIYDFQDQRFSDSLLVYLQDENPTYQMEAVQAFASIQDTLVSNQLVKMMSNANSNQLNGTIALALGQIGDTLHCSQMLFTFTQLDSLPAQSTLLRAIGRCLDDEHADQFATMSISADDELKEAHAWGIYRAGLKGHSQTSLIQKALQYLGSSNSSKTRLGAAHYLSRAPGLDLSEYENELVNSAQSDSSPEVRMASASALRKVKSTTVNNHLLSMLENESDYRVLINVLRALGASHQSKNTPLVMEHLHHPNPNVAVQAANYLVAHADGFYVDQLKEQIDTLSNKRVRATLITLLIEDLDSEQLMQYVLDEEDDYSKAQLISALDDQMDHLEFLSIQLLNRNTHPAIATAAASSIVELRRMEGISAEDKSDLLDVFKTGIQTGDVAIIGTFASALIDIDLNFKSEIEDVAFLKEALNQLTLPRDIETYREVQKAIDFFEETETEVPSQSFQHPIDWAFVQTIKKDQTVLVRTNKGDIVMQFYVEESPGSVAAILKLVQDGYYDGKTFHRVVPNFVAQGGCPRGDGWGSLDYTIRSEFTARGYDTGTVGLASSGKDTESCQWFITHSPTPHLDGRYTIIAEVTDGMDIVHQLEVGDVIQSMTFEEN